VSRIVAREKPTLKRQRVSHPAKSQHNENGTLGGSVKGRNIFDCGKIAVDDERHASFKLSR
jgi:hypothetical protein